MKKYSLLLLLISLSGFGQTNERNERKEIYEQILRNLIEPDKHIINETIAHFKNYDVDGDFQKWFYDQFPPTMTIGVEPVKYEKTVKDYLISNKSDFDVENLIYQIENGKLDYLENYLGTDNLISYKKAPLRNSWLGNIFKKKEAYGFSNIILGSDFAVVKINLFSRARKNHINSRIVILEKINNNWKIAKVLYEKDHFLKDK
ncbi:hypothetical protein ACFSRY_05665 [Pontibacter locisalis]|uniref:DUF3828 domain-containing protein n=1 Tax=Pontibacter locisalis TaxID=1719035 RepID=A0ABW5IIB5_9BACT